MQSSVNISFHPKSAIGNIKNSCFRYLQSIDNQNPYFYQNGSPFTGKEKDSETGFYYFSARYYDPSLSGLFLSVDPMADKYPNISPYAYCAWNPVRLVDPDGRKIDLSNLTKEQMISYNNNISRLQKNIFFNFYYSELEKSDNVYTIHMLNQSSDKGSGYYRPSTNEVGFIDNIHTICQELFHAYQTEINVYNESDKSVREAEGDIVSYIIAVSVGATCVGISGWDNGITDNMEYIDKDFNFKPDIINSSEFDNDFQTAVSNRVEFYKKRDSEEKMTFPPSYIQANLNAEAKAIKKVLSSIYE